MSSSGLNDDSSIHPYGSRNTPATTRSPRRRNEPPRTPGRQGDGVDVTTKTRRREDARRRMGWRAAGFPTARWTSRPTRSPRSTLSIVVLLRVLRAFVVTSSSWRPHPPRRVPGLGVLGGSFIVIPSVLDVRPEEPHLDDAD